MILSLYFCNTKEKVDEFYQQQKKAIRSHEYCIQLLLIFYLIFLFKFDKIILFTFYFKLFVIVIFYKQLSNYSNLNKKQF